MTEAFMFLILISCLVISFVIFFLSLSNSIFTLVSISPLIRVATSLIVFPLTLFPSTFKIISPALIPALLAGVSSTTLIIMIFPATDIMFTPIPTILASMFVFCSLYSSWFKNLEYGSSRLANIEFIAT